VFLNEKICGYWEWLDQAEEVVLFNLGAFILINIYLGAIFGSFALPLAFFDSQRHKRLCDPESIFQIIFWIACL